jgi:hypothetical protein
MGKWIALALLLAAGAYGVLLWQHLDFLAGRALRVAFGDAGATWQRAWVDWDGDVTAQAVVVPARDGGQDPMRFERLRLDTPGWGWLLLSVAEKYAGKLAPERLHLVLEGVPPAGGDPSLGALGVVGAASASPFEAEGCMADHAWTREDVLAMGLDPLPVTLDFDYRIEGGELHAAVVLTAPNVSTARLERRGPATGNVLLLGVDPAPTTFERWTVQDQGFVAARNAWCAKKDGTDVASFVERHVASVSRLMETAGIGADAEALAAYGAFAARGGEISFGGEYARPLDGGARDGGKALAGMDASLEHNGRRLPVRWRRFDPRPLPGRDKGVATQAALVAERGGIAAEPVQATAAMATSRGDGIISHANLISPGSTVGWDDLGALQGRWIQLWTAHNAPRHVMVLGMDRGQLQVRARLGGGHADYRITRGAFLRARLVQ